HPALVPAERDAVSLRAARLRSGCRLRRLQGRATRLRPRAGLGSGPREGLTFDNCRGAATRPRGGHRCGRCVDLSANDGTPLQTGGSRPSAVLAPDEVRGVWQVAPLPLGIEGEEAPLHDAGAVPAAAATA